MQRFLKRLLLFALPVVLLAAAVETLLQSAAHNLRQKAAYMEAHADSLEILVLGLSHAYKGVDLHWFERPGYNLAYNSQPLDCDYLLWQKYADKLPSLRCLILPLSCWTLEHSSENSGEQWRTPIYTKFYGLNASPISPKQHLMTAYPIFAFRLLSDILRGKHECLPEDEFGTMCTPLSKRNKTWQSASAKKVAERHSRQTPGQAAKNEALLAGIISQCRERGIRVVLFTPPGWHTYTDFLSQQIIDQTVAAGEKLAREYPNTVYVNLLCDQRFTEEDFIDSSHLNYDHGAKKLSLILKPYVDEACR